MNTLDPGIGPYVDGCLLLQAAFYNALWGMLFWGWCARNKRFPDEAKTLFEPSQLQIGVAAIVGVAVLASTIVAFQPIHWVLGLAFALGSFLSVLDPALALCFTVSMLLLRPWEVMEANPVILLMPRFSTLFSFAWALYYYAAVDKFSIRVNRVVLLLGAYFIWLFLSCFITPNRDASITTLMEIMWPYLMSVFLIYQLARSRFAIWAAKLSIITVFTAAGFISIYFFFNGYTLTGRIRAFGSFANTNDIAAVMAILLPLACGTCMAAKSAVGRVLAFFSTGVALTVLALAQSRGAIIALAIGLAIYVYRQVQGKTTALVVIGMIFAGAQLSTTLFNRDLRDTEGSTSSRSTFWVSGLRMGLLNPVFGVGFNEFPANVEAYALEVADEKGQHTAHSAWILAFAESGFLGLILFISFFYFGCLKPARLMYDKDPSWLYAGVMYAISITFLSHTYLIFPYLLCALVMVAYLAELKPARS